MFDTEDRIEKAGDEIRTDEWGCVVSAREARIRDLEDLARELDGMCKELLRWADEMCESSECIDHWSRMRDHFRPRLEKLKGEPPQGKDDDSHNEASEVERTQLAKDLTLPKDEDLVEEVSPVAERFPGVRVAPPRPRYPAHTEDD